MDTPEVFYNGGPGPAWLDRNAWAIPVQFSPENADKIPRIAMYKVELKVHMCCTKCEEIVSEEIRYLGGVFNVTTDRKISKVTVIGRPDPDRVLRRAKKVDRHATFWPVEVVEKKVEVKEEKEEVKVEEKTEDKKEEKIEEKKEEVKVEEVKVEEVKEETKEETKEEKKEAKKEEKTEEKKEEKKDEGEKKDTPPPAVIQSQQYPPYQSIYEGYPPYGFDYRPSQSYQPLYPDYNMGYFGPQVPFMNPNYLKHVKIAY